MKITLPLFTSIFWGPVFAAPNSGWKIGQIIETSSGPVQGHKAPVATDVSEYLGIPYAKPPIGPLRWAAPEPFEGSSALNGTKFGHACPSNPGERFSDIIADPTKWNLTKSAIQVVTSILSQTTDTFSEDCLTLNVWTKPQVGEKKKAVMIWIHGGTFINGASSSVGYNGQHLANDEDVIVVSLNYRLNIFGFPGSPASPNNLGLLDQRLAVEWVRDNIEAFGGDTKRITLFGESSGGGSADYYSFAWTHDPIVSGFIFQSGTANVEVAPAVSASSWYNASSALSCGNATSDASQVLACMRTKSQAEILKAINIPSLGAFNPTHDNKTVFSDALLRAAAGKFIQKPYLIGHNDHEFGLSYIDDPTSIRSENFYHLANLFSFNCNVALRAKFAATRAPTWRYRYFGDFPNLALTTIPPSGAWHGSEVPIVFGTDQEVQNLTERTPAQEKLVPYIMGAWAAFAKDPEKGLTKYKWPTYKPEEKTLVRLAYNNQTGPNLGLNAEYDFLCPFISTLGPTLVNPALLVDTLATLTRGVVRQAISAFAI